MTGPLAAYAANTFLLSSALSKEPIMFAKFIFRGDIDWLVHKVKEQADARAVFSLLHGYTFGDFKNLFSLKIGNGSFRDKVEFNSLIKSCRPDHICYKFQQTRGYWVITFAVNR
jgi:hypothetical protein